MRFTLALVLSLLAISCSSPPKEEKAGTEPVINADGAKLERSYHKNKKIRSEVYYKDKKKHGLSKSYNEDGKLVLELPYVDNKREGQSKRYYESGVVYQTTEYKDDMIHGKQVKYRPNGDLMSEATFEYENPCLGLKEYLEDKSLKKKYPKVIIKAIDRIESQGQYILQVSMSEKVKKVRYYAGELSKSGCITSSNYNLYLDEANKTGTMKYDLYPGQFLMEEVTITAVVETLMGNNYVAQAKHHVAIKN